MPLAWQVERLAPALATAEPNPEYPWQDSVSGDVIVPAAFDFDAFSPNRPRMAKLIELLDSLLAIAS